MYGVALKVTYNRDEEVVDEVLIKFAASAIGLRESDLARKSVDEVMR